MPVVVAAAAAAVALFGDRMLALVALLVQSVAESRLLVEYGLFLLAVIAVKTRRGRRWSPSEDLSA